MTGPGDIAGASSPAGIRIPLWAKVGYADLFCLVLAVSITEVSTLKAPGLPEKVAEGGVVLTLPVPEFSWLRFAEMRARREVETSLGSLLVLAERALPSGLAGGGAPSAPGGAPDAGSSVWMKQQRLP